MYLPVRRFEERSSSHEQEFDGEREIPGDTPGDPSGATPGEVEVNDMYEIYIR